MKSKKVTIVVLLLLGAACTVGNLALRDSPIRPILLGTSGLVLIGMVYLAVVNYTEKSRRILWFGILAMVLLTAFIAYSYSRMKEKIEQARPKQEQSK